MTARICKKCKPQNGGRETIPQDIDLIVMGTHGRTGLSHALMGSVAEKVVRLAPCPVLVTRGTTETSPT